jgi:hypothetical protein
MYWSGADELGAGRVWVWLASGPTDMRRGMNSLALQAQQVLKLSIDADSHDRGD